jgi:CHAT domain-containing protein
VNIATLINFQYRTITGLLVIMCFTLVFTQCRETSVKPVAPIKNESAFVVWEDSVRTLIGKKNYQEAVQLATEKGNIAWDSGCYNSWARMQVDLAKALNKSDEKNGLDAAIHYLNNSIEKSEAQQTKASGKLYFHNAYFYLKQKKYGDALYAYEKARQAHENGYPVTQFSGLYLYKALANIYTRKGEYNRAINLLHQGIDSLKNTTAQDEVAYLYCDLGTAYTSQADFTSALRMLEKGLMQNQAHPFKDVAENEFVKSILYANLSEIAFATDKYSEADSFALLALNLDPDNTAALSVCGDMAFYKKQFTLANRHYSKLQYLLESDDLVYNRELGKVLIQRATLASSQNNSLQALQHCNEALQTVLPAFEPQDIYANPDPSQFYPENTILEALNAKSEITWSKYQQNPQASWLNLAAQSTGLALQMNDTLIAAFGYTSSKLLSLEQTRDLYERNLAILFERKRQGHPDAAEAIFAFTERSKSMLLRQHLAENKALRQLPENLAERENLLRNNINNLREEYTSALAEALEENQLKLIKKAIFDAETTHQRFIDSLKQQFPAFYRATQAPVRTDLATVQKWLPADALLLSWFYNPESGALYLIGVDKQYIITRHEQLDSRRLKAFLALISNPQLNLEMEGDTGFVRSYAIEAQYLYDKLIRPVAGNNPPQELIAVPDGILGSIPLDALLPSAPDALSFRRLPYLLHQTRCRFAPSASLLMDAPRHKQSFDIGYLGIAPGYEGDSTFAAIAYNSACVEKLSEQLNGKKFIGPKASKALSLQSVEQCQVLHFYGHGQANSENPQASFLAFSSNFAANDKKTDSTARLLRPGLLAYNKPLPAAEAPRVWFAEEIGQRQLQAQLVLLSACETGLGKAAGTEGILSLSRAFQDAGVPSAVMTLWSVDDQASAQLSEALLLQLQSGDMRKDEALRQSKLQYLQSGGAASPFFWAGMVLTGDAAPLKIQASPVSIEIAGTPYPLISLAFVAGLLALIILLFYKIMRH